MNLLYYGDDPDGATGYSVQAKNILTRIHKMGINIACIGINKYDENPENPFSAKDRLPFKVYRANIEELKQDKCGVILFTKTFQKLNPDILFLMGDLWNFKGWLFEWLRNVQLKKKFKTIGYFSTEYPISKEEENILSIIDYPITHSKWGSRFKNKGGYDEIKKRIKKLIYIPDSVDSSIFFKYSEEQRETDRMAVGIKPDEFLITCVNRNSERKDVSALVNAFARVKKEINARLYLHMMPKDVYYGSEGIDLIGLCYALGLNIPKDVFFPVNFTAQYGYPKSLLNRIYNSSDLFVTTSVSEGFGVTPIEAMFAGVPVLMPDHTGFSKTAEVCGIDTVMSYTDIRIRITTNAVYPINEDDLVNRIIDVYDNKDKPKFKIKTDSQSIKAIENFDSNVVFDKYWKPVIKDCSKHLTTKKDRVLFLQYASAGDVFMSTSALKGIKEQHNLPIDYMTQKTYHDILKGNKYIDRIIDYEPSKVHEYKCLYMPHDMFIFRGNWNSNDFPLAKLYASLCNVEYNDPYIDISDINIELPDKYVVVHTTSHPYRNYYNFHIALNNCKLPIVQIGSKTDFVIGDGSFIFIDKRGLSYRESAYIISNASGFVGIDSFPAHIAGYFNIPMVITFGCGASRATAPLTKGKMRKIEPKYEKVCPLLGPCAGNFRCKNPCGPRHNPILVRRAIKEIIPDCFEDVEKQLRRLICQQ